jgi:HPt (histidine-containing phosphotransfer) domain-containing protein
VRNPKNPASEVCLAGLESYYQEFLNDRLLELNRIKVALKEDDYIAVAELAHKWKGIAAPYGFGILGEIANELEVAALDKSHAASFLLVTEAENYLLTDKKKATHS